MRDASRGAHGAARAGIAVLSAAAAIAALPSPAAAQQPVGAAPVVIDGPSPDIVRPSGLGLSVARDGTGGLVYLKQVAGVAHVFVSQLAGGSFQPPVQVDASLPGASSQPVIAAGNGGLLLVAFINAGELYVVNRGSQTAPFGAPGGLAGGAINPSISMSNFGKAYLAFAVADGAGYDVRSGYYYNGRWALESAPLNAVAADDAGTGAGRPQVATAGDGIGIVVWGEGGHIYSRRVWTKFPSVVYEQADAALSGCTEVSADEPVVGTEGDSSYAQVAFHEVLTCGGQQLSRVLANRLQASVYNGISVADGLVGPSDGADAPQITMSEYGPGWITAARNGSHDLFATALGGNGQIEGSTQVNSLGNATAPAAVPATAGLFSSLIAWQQNPGSAGLAEVRFRYAPDGETLGPEVVISSPVQGPADAANGLAAAGDISGDAAVAWLQGPAGAAQIVAGQLYQGPGYFSPVKGFQYATGSQPSLAWTAAHELWGPMHYVLSIDGNQVTQTTSTSAQAPAPLSDGPHSWQVTGSNPAGQQSQSRAATVFVDTIAPTAAVTVFGRNLVGAQLHVFVSYVDLPPAGEPPADASGVAKLAVLWGDGTVAPLALGSHRSFHAYPRPGRYQITAVAIDRAGNVTRALTYVQVIKPKPKPKPKKHTGKPPPKAKGK
jgi:hypothetical protein